MILAIYGIKKTKAHRYREPIGGCQREGEWWTKWVKGVKKIKASGYKINKS